MNPGTLFLQARSTKHEPWHVINLATFSDEITYLNRLCELEDLRAGWMRQHSFVNQVFRIITSEDIQHEENRNR